MPVLKTYNAPPKHNATHRIQNPFTEDICAISAVKVIHTTLIKAGKISKLEKIFLYFMPTPLSRMPSTNTSSPTPTDMNIITIIDVAVMLAYKPKSSIDSSLESHTILILEITAEVRRSV